MEIRMTQGTDPLKSMEHTFMKIPDYEKPSRTEAKKLAKAYSNNKITWVCLYISFIVAGQKITM